MGQREDGAIAVVGATGAVGRELVGILAASEVSRERVRCFASDRSIGVEIPFGDGAVTVRALDTDSFHGASIAFFMASGDVARRYVPDAVDHGSLVIDNSSAFRMDPGVPLVVPEVNNDQIYSDATVISNPNCSTIILLTALDPIRRVAGIAGVDVVTYQAVSGAGLEAMAELRDQTAASLEGRTTPTHVFAESCAFNVFSHDSAVDILTGINGEERKIIDETRKIWGDPAVRVTPTCVRVPVFRSHTMAITVETNQPVTEGEIREALRGGAGLRIVDDRAANRFPTPIGATGNDPIDVGRIRRDPGAPVDAAGRCSRWCLMAAGDQLRKGAALNAVQIARAARPALFTVRPSSRERELVAV